MLDIINIVNTYINLMVIKFQLLLGMDSLVNTFLLEWYIFNLLKNVNGLDHSKKNYTYHFYFTCYLINFILNQNAHL